MKRYIKSATSQRYERWTIDQVDKMYVKKFGYDKHEMAHILEEGEHAIGGSFYGLNVSTTNPAYPWVFEVNRKLKCYKYVHVKDGIRWYEEG